MGFFITEKEVEDYLAQETRDIVMPDGTRRPMTAFKLAWRSFDFILDNTEYVTEQTITGWAQDEAQGSGRSFEQAFHAVLAYAHRDLRRRFGID